MHHFPPNSDETERLLLQAQTGDCRAFGQLFAEYRPYLHQLITLRMDPKLRSRIDPSDVIQDTQVEAFRRLEEFVKRQPMPFRLWLRKTACERLNQLWEYHVTTARRSLSREVALPDLSSQSLTQRILAKHSTPSQQLSRRELTSRVNSVLAQLSDTDREIVIMRHYEELSYEEITAVLEITTAAARKRYARALLRLQDHLAQSGLLEFQP